MSDVKFTPGPWHIGDEKHGDFYIWGPDRKAFGYIAQANALGSSTNPRTEREANARLIAAAPDLFEALKELYDDQQGPLTEAMQKAQAAIARATAAT